MAFQNYMNGTSMPEVSGGGHQQQQIQQQQNPGQQAAPSIVPLSLELVPPVLCQSFGVPMHDQFVQRIGYGVPGAMRPRNDMFRFGHAENYQAQHFLTDQTQMPYQPSLASIGQMGPLVYGLGNGAVGFAQQANANRVMQYNTALAQQQSQNQQSSAQQGHPQHGQQQADAPAAQAMQHAHMPACQPFYRSPGIAVAGHGYIDANMLRHPMMQGADGRSEARDEDGRGVKRSSLSVPGMTLGRASVMEPVKRSRLVWTPDLHQRFEEAVERAGGIDVAVPKTVLEHMAVPGLTRDNVASHLQKHRMHVKKAKEPRVVDSHNNGNSPCATVSGTDDAQLPVQRCSVDGPTANKSADREHDLVTLESSEKYGNPSASNLHTSDSASGRTAFTLAVRSGVNSTPDSRETGNGVVMDTSAAGSNMASSARLQANGTRSAGTGNGVSLVEASGDPSSWGGYVTGAGSATAAAVPPQATASSAVPKAAIVSSQVIVAQRSQQVVDASTAPDDAAGHEDKPSTVASAPRVSAQATACGKSIAAGHENESGVAVAGLEADAGNARGE